jgi:hypothetical protein
MAQLKHSRKCNNTFCQYSAKTFWMFPKLATVVRMSTRPFRTEIKSTNTVPEKFARKTTPKVKAKQRIKLVFNDLAVAAISDAVESSLFIIGLLFSSNMALGIVSRWF